MHLLQLPLVLPLPLLAKLAEQLLVLSERPTPNEHEVTAMALIEVHLEAEFDAKRRHWGAASVRELAAPPLV